MVEVSLFGHLTGDPCGLLAGPEGLLPDTPLHPGSKGRRGAAGQQNGHAGLSRRLGGDETGHRGEEGVRLGDSAFRGDGRVPRPPGVVLGGAAGVGVRALAVAAHLQLGQDAGGQPVAGARRGEQTADRQLAQRGVGVGVPHERRQMGLVRHLAAECDGEAQGLTGGLAQPGGEQGGGSRALTEAGQREAAGRLAPAERRRVGRVVVVAVGRFLAGAQAVALAQQGAGLDEAERQPFGLEPEVSRPVRLLFGERALHDVFHELDRGAAAETGEDDRFEVRVGRRRSDVGGRREEERALRGGVEQFLERGAAELQVVDDDDGADPVDEREEPFAVGPLQRSAVNGLEQPVQQLAGRPLVSGEPYDPVGREVRAVGGDGVQEGRAAGPGRPGQAHGAAAGEQPQQTLALVPAFEERHLRRGRARRDGRRGGAFAVRTLGGGAAYGRGGPLPRATGLDLAAVDRIDREEEVARCQLHRARLLRGRLVPEVGRQRVAGRTSRRAVVTGTVVAVLFRSPVGRVHRLSPPDAQRAVAPSGLARPAVAPGPVSASGFSSIGRRPNLKPSHSIYEPVGGRAVPDITFS